MILLVETALTVLLIWTLASFSLILGGCISACVLRTSASPPPLVICRQAPYQSLQKSDVYFN